MDGDKGASGGVFGVVGPGIGGGFVCDFDRFERDRRIPRAIEPFRTLLANAQAPVGLVAKCQDEDGVVRRLRRRRT
jgi:hypothetical protein